MTVKGVNCSLLQLENCISTNQKASKVEYISSELNFTELLLDFCWKIHFKFLTS